ncbi:hypothetical protein R8Z50_25480 [Longispora sp. K20-0274]|uniref:hypothetical protein n=1 Tax=Longispora sp. K20-0274 TaxID=3088255 RepID=UPI00399A5987
MTDEPTVVSGLRLAEPSRRGRFGTWWSATTHAGATRGALLLDPALSQGPALDHVIAQVVAVRGLAVPGVLPVVDVVTEYGKVWMVTAEPATPTVAELLASDSPHDGDDAIAVALWTGQTLLSLHSGGLAHGDFGAHSVVLAASGAAALIEVALAPGDRAADVRAWSALLRVLAGRWGDPGLTRAAAVADSAGLAAGLEELARIDPGPALTGPALAEPTVVLRPGTSAAEAGAADRTVRIPASSPGTGPAAPVAPVPGAPGVPVVGSGPQASPAGPAPEPETVPVVSGPPAVPGGGMERTRQFQPEQTVGLGSTARLAPPPVQPPGGGPTMTLGSAPTVRVDSAQVPAPPTTQAGSPQGPGVQAPLWPAPGQQAGSSAVGAAPAPAANPVGPAPVAPGSVGPADGGRRPDAAEAARAIDELTMRTDESTVIRPGPVPIGQPGAAGLGEVTRPAPPTHPGPPAGHQAQPGNTTQPGQPTQAGNATQPGQPTQWGTATGMPTQLGTRSATTAPPAGDGSDVRLRFGGGIPAGVEEAWRAGPPVPPKPGKKPVKRWRRIVGGLVTGAIIGGVVGYFWWYNAHPLKVTAAAVAPASPPGTACDVTVDVVGTVTTNGRPGTITYQWLRSDGEATQELSQSVSSGTKSVPLHLHWKFSGKGEYQAKATLKILGPTPTEAAGEFTYSCR